MNNNQRPESDDVAGGIIGFFKDLFKSLANALVQYVVAFAVGTGAGALVCLYYGVPLAFSLVGGFIVLGLALALMSDSLFS